MKKPFDPFDPKHAAWRPRRRRTNAQIQADEEARWRALEHPVRKALALQSDPDYVDVKFMMEDAMNNLEGVTPAEMRRNVKNVLERLGYVKMHNKKSKDGRWFLYGEHHTIYKKRLLANLGYRRLEEYMDS